MAGFDGDLEEALAWIRAETAAVAERHPEHVKQHRLSTPTPVCRMDAELQERRALRCHLAVTNACSHGARGRGRHHDLVSAIAPMLLTTARERPLGGDWILEPKWDGYRFVAHVEDGCARCWTGRTR